ncbi:uncharacterized protein [Euwallacea fornicatus]|uniref:uncharacterized protein n=1 Tax=Euwallacea fornicatus TaxID=995702 RepID=UPI00338D5F3F
MEGSRGELRVLQINLDRGRLATDLLHQEIREGSVDVVLGLEPGGQGNFVRDRCDDSFIWLAPGVGVQSIHRDRGFVAAELDGITLVSAYFSPNKTTAEFSAWLGRLEEYVRGRDSRRVFIAGDLNAKSGRFGSVVGNAYGRVLEEFLEATALIPINTGGEWTFSNRMGSSLIDVTMAGDKVASRVRMWKVENERESGSCHRYFTYRIKPRGEIEVAENVREWEKAKGWKLSERGLE